MEQYIPKSALVAEIEKCYNECLKRAKITDSDYWNAKADAYRNVLESLNDTLEVKEVNLEKYYHDFLQKEWFEKNCNRTMSEMMAFTAKHFFELGLNTQYSSINIPNIDDILEENGVNPFSNEAKSFKENYYMALEKLKAQKGELYEQDREIYPRLHKELL